MSWILLICCSDPLHLKFTTTISKSPNETALKVFLGSSCYKKIPGNVEQTKYFLNSKKVWDPYYWLNDLFTVRLVTRDQSSPCGI